MQGALGIGARTLIPLAGGGNAIGLISVAGFNGGSGTLDLSFYEECELAELQPEEFPERLLLVYSDELDEFSN